MLKRVTGLVLCVGALVFLIYIGGLLFWMQTYLGSWLPSLEGVVMIASAAALFVLGLALLFGKQRA
jgi:hypothetical protein